MFSVADCHLSSLLEALRLSAPDLLLVASCGRRLACHSSLLCLLSSSLSSLLAQHPREQGECLAISLPLDYTTLLKVLDIRPETLPQHDIFDTLSESPAWDVQEVSTKDEICDYFEIPVRQQDNKTNNEENKEPRELQGASFLSYAEGNLDRIFSCSHCEQTFNENNMLKQHQLNHIGDKAFDCSSCGASFSEKKGLKTHLKVHLSKLKSFKRHTNIHEKNTLEYSEANILLSKKSNEKSDVSHTSSTSDKITNDSTALSKEKELLRDNSGVSLNSKGEIVWTIDNKTENIRAKIKSMVQMLFDGITPYYKCAICEKTTKCGTRKGDMEKHIETHIEGLSYPCTQCDKIFR